MQITEPENKNHLAFLDALRGISALAVVIFHAMLFTPVGNETTGSAITSFFTLITGYGHLAVPVFIVLSGFCLTITVVNSPDKKLKGGFKGYIFRRFKRIAPPYYAALAFSLLLIAVIPALQQKTNTAWDSKIPVTADAVASHLLLVHNIKGEWIYKINGAMWSLATEWQIYFIFPILLYVRKLSNTIMATLFAVLLGFFFLYIGIRNPHPHYIGLFAMGMLAAVMAFSSDEILKRILKETVNKFTFLSLLVLCSVVLIAMRSTDIPEYIYETIIGFAVAFLLVCTANSIRTNASDKYLAHPLLTNKITIWLGSFSYSLYLIHGPILATCSLYLIKTGLGYDVRLLLMWLLVVPFATALAYLFYLFFEKPFTVKIK